ncbi:hypothetical protein TraAM80_08840 [Trypanosoma rangeli]|uniref:MYND-type domain-containing protein n=1 Tax=Trypanosoma rangeli TaxID=5698 RepID=A0A3R7M2S8_TRYRA|nr:uncharacterized protein TraAM80_08840 [Trypanosoma rangeli]RNE98310.1 hypothetical protein TraAM80_08840 [Trypanosoma rangeli]|eukprot:RNE98310.1 hypothetical protein TraAM80_08840 [Trypanosoma rangeli]
MGDEEAACSDEKHVVTEATLERTVNNATVLRYPFSTMDLGWLVGYIDAFLLKSERWSAAMRITTCFMTFTVLHEDPLMEDATFQLHKMMVDRSIKKSWPRRNRDLSNAFDAAYHVFETICIVAKYPNLEPAGKVGILRMSEKLIQGMEKPMDPPLPNVDVKRRSEALSVTLTRLQALGRVPDSLDAFDALMASLKMVFFCYAASLGVQNMLQDTNISQTNSYVCCEGCPCYVKFRTTYTLFIRDVEKTKVIDCLLMMAVKEDDAFVSKLTEGLFAQFDCRSPFLEKPVRRIQNGALFMVRIALFDAFRHTKALLMDSRASPASLAPQLDSVALALCIARREMKGVKGLSEHPPLVDKALATADGIYPRLGTEKASQGLRALKDHIAKIFALVSAPQFHLAAHSKDPPLGKDANLRCGNPMCPGQVKEMLKCSGCRVTFYCSVACQRDDWKTHRFLCKEMGCRRTAPAPVAIAECPIQTLKPAALQA